MSTQKSKLILEFPTEEHKENFINWFSDDPEESYIRYSKIFDKKSIEYVDFTEHEGIEYIVFTTH